MTLRQPNIIGICGREGAGKTTLAKALIIERHEEYEGQERQEEYEEIFIYGEEVEWYILCILFGWEFSKYKYKQLEVERDVIWGHTVAEAKVKIMQLLKENVASDYEYTFARVPLYKRRTEIFSFAKALKQVCTAIFNIPYTILLGEGEKNRKLREKIKTRAYNVAGVMSGREVLEYMGTNVFREKWDIDCWIKIFKREARQMLASGKKVIIEDVRFKNEYQAIKDCGGIILKIYKEEKDLKITDKDRESHPAKWEFLKFEADYKIKNNKPVKDMVVKIKTLIHGLN